MGRNKLEHLIITGKLDSKRAKGRQRDCPD